MNFSINSLNFTCEFEIDRVHSTSHQLTKKITTHKQNDTNEQAETAEVTNLIKNSIYFGAHRNLVNEVAGGGTYFDLSVGSMFTKEWDFLKNGTDTQNASSALRAERLIADLLEWPSLSINASSDKKQIFLTKNGVERYAISELGSGISELVICIVTAAIKKPTWIFIDEPESHLHPTLQIKFIEALTMLASHGLVFTTHSIGLARTCADTILVVQQDKQNRSSLRPYESINNFSQLLGELSFSQFHELGYNKLLLCEGVTEVKTLRQILRHWKLDSSVMIVPLGGDALINSQRQHELNDFNRFGVEVFVIVDSERTSAEVSNLSRTKFITLCNELFGKNHAMETELRATENYFTLNAITSGMRSEKYTQLEPFQNSKDAESFWGKNENWKIAAEMTKEDWLKTDIGQFIQKMTS
nr:AAA family ATPase [uncultured Undibacterium sp.]